MEPNNDNVDRQVSLTSLTKIEPMNLNGNNLGRAWKDWKTSFKIFLRASGLELEADQRKVALFLHNIGTEALQIFYSFDLDIDTVTFKTVQQAFEDYFTPKINITMERHTIFNRRQGDNESIEAYATTLKNLSLTCEFGDLRESLVKDIFSWNLNAQNQYIKERLLTENLGTLDEVVRKAKVYETSKEQAKILKNYGSNCEFVGELKEVSEKRVSRRPFPENGYSSRTRFKSPKRTHSPSVQENPVNTGRFADNYSRRSCGRCGQLHKFGQCPAYGKKCGNCQLLNHFARFCRFNNVNSLSVNNESTENKTYLENESLFIGSMSHANENSLWYVNISINNKSVKCLIDTGSEANVLSMEMFHSLNLPLQLITNSNKKLSTFSGNSIATVGIICTDVYYVNRSYSVQFYIVDIPLQTIIGLETCKQMNLVKRIQNVTFDEQNNSKILFEKYEDVFNGLGDLKDFQCKLTLKPDVPPFVDACRRVPFALQDKFRTELNRMVDMNVIEKVTGPTEWVNSFVIVGKPNGSLRICIDPRRLNEAIIRHYFPFPLLDEIRNDLNGACYFSVIDAKSGFWMIKLDEESSKLCTFITPEGRFKFLRLPFGINAAPEIFHREMVLRFNDLKGVKVMMDDFLIYGKTIDEHNYRLECVLKRAREIGIKFNKEKSQICVTEVKYLGHIFSKDGMRIDKSRVEAICKMPEPSNIKELQRFLGMVNYLGPFIPNLSNEIVNLRKLLTKNISWSWEDCHKKEIDNLKKLITSAPVLTHFSPDKQLILSVDSSSYAVGAVISHDKPISYASASLNNAQQNYSQIEKELLALLFGCVKFHQYIYGNKVVAETDHKPIVSLFKRALYKIPPRLQRIMLKLQQYDLQVVYKPGKYLYIPDTLSRAPLAEKALEYLDQDIDLHVNLVVGCLILNDYTMNKIKRLTEEDETLQKLIFYNKNGWPEHRKYIHDLVKPYFAMKDDINVIDGLVFNLSSIIIPKALRKEMLELIHEGHQGINSCKRLARESMYWPNMNKDIEVYIQSCSACLTYARNNPKEPLVLHQYKLLPWNKIGMDLFEFQKNVYLILVDYFSKFVEIAVLKDNHNSLTVITQLKSIFARHGIPEIIISDNGPPFNSDRFKDFTSEWGIQHITSSPYHSRSNGLVERTIGTIKNMFYKCSYDGTDPYLALLNYRNTKKESLYSPAQLCMSRSLRTKLPIIEKKLMPELCDYDKIEEFIKDKERRNSIYYNQGCKDLAPLAVNDAVMFKKHPLARWIPGRIIKVGPEPRSYVIECEQGVFRRNRQLIRGKSSILTQNPNDFFIAPNQDSGAASSQNDFTEAVDSSQTALTEGVDAGINIDIVNDEPSTSGLNNCHRGYVSRYGRVCKPPDRL